MKVIEQYFHVVLFIMLHKVVLLSDVLFHLCSGGLETESEYPYEGADEKCKFKESEAVVYLNDSVSIPQDENSKSLLSVCGND